MIDVKKLVTGFLVLAVAASASAFLISAIGGSGGTQNSGSATAIATGLPGANGTAANSGQSAALTGNAFLPESATQNPAAIATANDSALASTTDAIMNDPNNLTNILANTYLNNLALTNQNGPATDANGNPTLTPPNNNNVINQFMSSSTTANVQIPDWDIEANEIPIITTSSSPGALASYGIALDGILNSNIIQTNMQSMLSNNSDPSFEPYVAGKVQTALQDISGLQTPTSAVPLQKSLIKTLVYAKNVIALGENAAIDPLKTELVIEAEDPKYQAAVQDLQSQLQKAELQNLFSFAATAGTSSSKTSDIFANIQNILGISVAHAQIPVLDFITHLGVWTTVANMIKAEIKDVVLQIIKNTIVFLMQKTIFAAMQSHNGGPPAFIQQWGVTLANAYQASALNALDSQMSCLGSGAIVAPFAPQVNLTLKAPYQPDNNICSVQFNSQLGNNLSNFYSDFSNGGWLTFGATLQPDNNYGGSVFFMGQDVANTAQNAQNAAQAKAIANQGFTGSAACTDGSNPNGKTLTCKFGNTDTLMSTQSSTCPIGWNFVESIPNNGYCNSGKMPEVQTPGKVFDNMIGSAISGNFQLISSAKAWEGLASGLFVSILQQVLDNLATTAISGAQGLLQQAAAGGGATSVSPDGLSVKTGANSPQEMTCTVEPDVSGNPFVAFITITGGEVITSSGISTPSYTWTQPANVTLSATTGDSVTATFNATGTYPIVVNDLPDNASTTCEVTIPVPLQ